MERFHHRINWPKDQQGVDMCADAYRYVYQKELDRRDVGYTIDYMILWEIPQKTSLKDRIKSIRSWFYWKWANIKNCIEYVRDYESI